MRDVAGEVKGSDARDGARITSVAAQAASSEFRNWVTDLLVEVCAIDTSPKSDVAAAANAEDRVFGVLEREFAALRWAEAAWRRVPIDPCIAEHPFYSTPYYSRRTSDAPPLTAAECYRGRGNLIFTVDGAGESGTPGETAWSARRTLHGAGGSGTRGKSAINVHVDVVAPYTRPTIESGVVHGRGACDDKGNVVALLGALRLVRDYLVAGGLVLRGDLTGMFVIDEETGGNGSLSCAIDRDLKRRYDNLLVLECTDQRIHPGNRGCVWYKVDGSAPGVNLFEAAAFIVEALEEEGRALRNESDHPLFPHRPVQTCHGIIGSCGEHPSYINGDVSFRIEFTTGASCEPAAELVRALIDRAIGAYVVDYGDKTRVIDPATGKPKVFRHVDVLERGSAIRVRVWGATGHMGSILENDGAITKMATIVRQLVCARGEIESATGSPMRLVFDDWPDSSVLLLEGGQGFVPTHTLDAVEQRVRAAVLRGAEKYFALAGCDASPDEVLTVTFEKLHNAAFAGDPDSADMRVAIDAARAADMWDEGPIRGWDVSCDARIFACEYPELPVLTAGAGALRYAHSDDERIEIDHVAQVAEFLAYYILMRTGTVDCGVNGP